MTKTSGYSDCPCRDCFEIAMDGDLCGDCEEAGCSAEGDEECSAPSAYGGDDLCACGASLDDGEGFDGLCGNCADRAEAE